MIRRLPRVLLLLALLVPASAAAIPVVEAPPSELRALERARRLIEVTRAEAALEASAMQSFDLQLEHFRALRPELSEAGLAQFRAIFRDELRRSIDEVLGAMAELWATHFTADELDRLLAFYHTRVGQKVLERMPLIMHQARALGTAWGSRVGQRAMRRFDAGEAGPGS